MKKRNIWIKPISRILRCWGITCAVGGVVLMAWVLLSSPPTIGHTRRNLATELSRLGFSVAESDIVVAGGLPRDGARWATHERTVVFLGAGRLSRRLDLWAVRAELSPGGVPLALRDLRNLSGTFWHNERQAAVGAKWALWPSPAMPGLFHLVWLPDPNRRFGLRVTPAPEDAAVALTEGHARISGTVAGRPVEVRVDLQTGEVLTRGDVTASLAEGEAPAGHARLAGPTKVR